MRMRSLAWIAATAIVISLALTGSVRSQSPPAAFAVFMSDPETTGVDALGFYVEFPMSSVDGVTQIGVVRVHPQPDGTARWDYIFTGGGRVTATGALMSANAILPPDGELFPRGQPAFMRYARGTITDASEAMTDFVGGFIDMRALHNGDPEHSIACVCRIVPPPQ